MKGDICSYCDEEHEGRECYIESLKQMILQLQDELTTALNQASVERNRHLNIFSMKEDEQS